MWASLFTGLYISLLASAGVAEDPAVFFVNVENDSPGQTCKAAIEKWLASEVKTTDTLADATVRLEVEKYNKALRIWVFDLARKNLIEAKTYRLRNGCQFSPRINALAKKWVRRVFGAKRPRESLRSITQKAPASSRQNSSNGNGSVQDDNTDIVVSTPSEVGRSNEPSHKQETTSASMLRFPEEDSRTDLSVSTRLTLARARISFREPRALNLRDFELPLGGFAEAEFRYRYAFGSQLRYGPDFSVRYRRSVGLSARSLDKSSTYSTGLDSLFLRAGGHISVLYLGIGFSRARFLLDLEEDSAELNRLPEYEAFVFGPTVGLAVPVGKRITIGLESELLIAGSAQARDASLASSTEIYGLRSALELQLAITGQVKMLAGLLFEQQSIDLGDSVLAGGIQDVLLGGRVSLVLSN